MARKVHNKVELAQELVAMRDELRSASCIIAALMSRLGVAGDEPAPEALRCRLAAGPRALELILPIAEIGNMQRGTLFVRPVENSATEIMIIYSETGAPPELGRELGAMDLHETPRSGDRPRTVGTEVAPAPDMLPEHAREYQAAGLA